MEYSNIAIIIILLLSIIFLVIFGSGSKQSIEAEITKKVESQTPNQLLEEFKRQSQTLKLCTFGGGLLTFLFVVAFFVGGDMNPMTWGLEQWFAVLAGAFVVFSITAVQYNLYQDINGSKVGIAITIGILAFVYYSEIASTAEREAELVRDRSAKSSVLHVTLDAIKTSSAAPVFSNNAGEIARAARLLTHHKNELAICAGKYAVQGRLRIERCERWERNKAAEYQAMIDSYKSDDNANRQARVSNTSALITQAKSLEYNEQQHAAIVKFFKSTFDLSFSAAMMFAAFILVNAFELGFHYSGSQVGQLKAALARVGYDLKTNANDYEIESARLELLKMQHALGTKKAMQKIQQQMHGLAGHSSPVLSGVGFSVIEPKQVQVKQQPSVPKQVHAPKKVRTSAPKKVRSEPKKVRSEPKKVRSEPKKVRSEPKKVRPKITADTGTVAPHNQRYLALIKAIQSGQCGTSCRAIKAFKYGGRGMGTSTAKYYREALVAEGVIS